MKRKSMLIFLLAVTMCLSISVQAAVVTFHTTAPTPGPLDVFNLVGVAQDRDNVGTATTDGPANDATTYVAFDRSAQGQTFVTGSSESIYMLAAVWVQHTGYTTENTVNTWYTMPTNSELGVRITDPSASGTDGFILSSETYTITGDEENVLPPGPTLEGTGTWIHVALDTPIPLSPSTTYGFDLTAIRGTANLFFELMGIKDTAAGGNPYTAGTAYTSGGQGAAGNTLTNAPGDRVFIVELLAMPPVTASLPYPTNKAIAIPQDVILRWIPGFYADRHDVYFGESLTNVNTASTSTPEIYKGRQDANSFSLDALTPDTTYYWRIDEVRADGSTIDKGNIWSFTTEPSKAWGATPYNGEVGVFIDPDPNLSWNSGYNSTGSVVYFGTSPDTLELQTTITHTQGIERYACDISGLINNQNYFWRVDETQADSSVIMGDLWQFRTIPIIPVSNPALVGWWKFDEGSGKAIDWSGLNQHGTIYGNAESVYGYDGSALEFDGMDDYVELPIGSTLTSLDSATITSWVNFTSTLANQHIFDFGIATGPETADPNVNVYMFVSRLNTTGTLRFAITTSGIGGEQIVDTSTTIAPGSWNHVAVTIDEATGAVQIYVNGDLVGTGSTEILPSALGNVDGNWLGKSKFWDPPDPYFTGFLDDFRIYNDALSQNEIDLIMKIDPLRARDPRPANGSTADIISAAILSWLPGDNAVEHDVYFGADAAAVENAVTSTAQIYRGRQGTSTYTLPELLEWNRNYYWRIDEVGTDATIGKGPVWTFTVADYLLVDDFESYNDINPDQEGSRRIYLIWMDGFDNPSTNGSTIGYPDPSIPDGEHFVETDIVHSGNQSTPLFFDNRTASLSEVTVNTNDLPIGLDWTVGGPETLSLWVYGDPNNPATEQMYVEINSAKVVISDIDLTQAAWQEVTVDLAAFNTNLSNVTTFGIGFERTAAAGGSGMVFIDDIRLYLPLLP